MRVLVLGLVRAEVSDLPHRVEVLAQTRGKVPMLDHVVDFIHQAPGLASAFSTEERLEATAPECRTRLRAEIEKLAGCPKGLRVPLWDLGGHGSHRSSRPDAHLYSSVGL